MPPAFAAAATREPRPGFPALGLIGVLGIAAAIATAWAVWDSPVVDAPKTTAAIKGFLVAMYLAVGLYTWWHRPRSRLGALVSAVAFIYAVTSLAASKDPLAFTAGRVTVAALTVYFVYLFLCFPRDRLSSSFERRFVVVFAAASAGVWAVVLALVRTLPRGGAFSDCTQHCPENPLRLVDASHNVTQAINLTANGLTAAGLLMLIVLLLRKASSPGHLRRRAVTPLLYAATLFVASFASYSVLSQANASPNETVLRILTAAGALAVPVALLIGQFRGRVFAATNLWHLLESARSHRLTPVWVEGILGSSLGDPSFALALWSPDRNGYVDANGEPLELPEASVARSVTLIEAASGPAIALLHDPALDDEPEIVEGLGATAVMLLENARLVEELRASRARIAESAENERLRLERDLHDGAQQRLMAIQIKLAIARERAEGDVASQLDDLASDASAAVEELRSLAHGIYPGILRERGLGEALEVFVPAAPIPIRIIDRGVGRTGSVVEAAVYYCSLEAIQNAVKHAGPRASVIVTLARPAERIEFEVADDGAGFEPATQLEGYGLVSMRDRIDAVHGQVSLESSPGRGTRVFGSVPVADETVADRP